MTLYFVAQDVKLGSRFDPPSTCFEFDRPDTQWYGSESCHIQLIFTWYRIMSVKSYWKPL